MESDSVEIWSIYQSIHDVFQDRRFTAQQAENAAGCSQKDLRLLMDVGLLVANGDQLQLVHGKPIKQLGDDLRSGKLD